MRRDNGQPAPPPAPAPFGEWRGADRLAPWLWVPLLAMVAIPFPWPSFILPERAVPILWLLVVGWLCLLAPVARVSWPLAALMLWALGRAWLNEGIRMEPLSLQTGLLVMESGRARPIQLLVLLTMVAALYVAARRLSPQGARLAAWALILGIAYEAVFGWLNVFGHYPWMGWVQPDQVGRPMGFLTHPNYFGSFVALGLPVVWALLGLAPVLVLAALIVVSWSGGPVISAAVGLAVAAWPRLTARVKYGLLIGLTGVVSVVMTVHEWRLSGRREVWQAVWPELARYPLIGQGLGSWRGWADAFNAKRAATTGTFEAFATLQAHNEPYQLWFELGLVGLLLAGCWAWQAWGAARTVWRQAPLGTEARWWQPGWLTLDRAWLAVLAVGLTNALGSPTFHLPAQAAITLFALARLQAWRPVASPLAPVHVGQRRRRRLEAEAVR